MKHQIDEAQRTSLGVIELLNNLGFNIVHIDNTYYAFSEFIPVDDTMSEISMTGKNITNIIENQTSTIGLDNLRQREIVSKIEVMTDRRRVFSPTTKYVKYLFNG
jgi:hypothetical protein